MPSNSMFVCVPCRWAGHGECPGHHVEHILAGKRWRAPRKTNDRAWKLIESGDLWWDKRALHKTTYLWPPGWWRVKGRRTRLQPRTPDTEFGKER